MEDLLAIIGAFVLMKVMWFVLRVLFHASRRSDYRRDR